MIKQIASNLGFQVVSRVGLEFNKPVFIDLFNSKPKVVKAGKYALTQTKRVVGPDGIRVVYSVVVAKVNVNLRLFCDKDRVEGDLSLFGYIELAGVNGNDLFFDQHYNIETEIEHALDEMAPQIVVMEKERQARNHNAKAFKKAWNS
jgi:hypothetical protein